MLDTFIIVRSFELIIRIMTTKLTLTVEKSVIERAKLYSKNSGRSLSELITTYLDSLTKDTPDQKLSPKLKKIVGAVKLPKNFNMETELRSYYEKKHL